MNIDRLEQFVQRQAISENNVIVEMGHIYLNPNYLGRSEVVSSEEFDGVNVGMAVAALLAQEGVPTQKMLFVDDLHGGELADGMTENPMLHQQLNAVLHSFQERGFSPDIIISEAEMTTAAAHLYALLKSKGVISGNARHLPEFYGGAQLKTGSSTDEWPSCSLIDAALYLKKLGVDQNTEALTVIHEKYKPQQQEVRKILAAYGLAQPQVCVVYYDDMGEVTEIEEWFR